MSYIGLTVTNTGEYPLGEDAHITIAYLGQEPYTQEETWRIEKVIRIPPFRVDIVGLMRVGKYHQLLALQVGSPLLQTYYDNVMQEPLILGHTDRTWPFNPHITLGAVDDWEEWHKIAGDINRFGNIIARDAFFHRSER
jgi:2'-5' RNA ligase